ncbi:MAG TPA: YoaK family protein [Usitatibacter sp.]|jgi:uncharacterized membrane protein YoaK (UPF0700 family)|nr:YoaK family protein [Usitatibacter sp.]
MRRSLEETLPALLLVLTATTGLVDAVSYLALGHVFTANMTGNVVFLGFALGGVSQLSIPLSLTALLAFVAGAVAGGGMAARIGAKKAWTGGAFLSEALLLACAAAAAWGLRADSGAESYRLYAIVALMAAAMGIRNAAVRKLAVPNLTTTVLTLTLAGIGADSSLAGGKNPGLGTRIASVVLMFLGALVGAVLLRYSVALPILLAAVAAAVCGLVVLASTEMPASIPPERHA